ncbi:hypothetical protein BGI37_04940 [Snodgrassella alvi]|jgi:YesN/AraC family two-component response regulator|nr:hypothetical protein BGI37_04940 [Snodgrassella alvi]
MENEEKKLPLALYRGELPIGGISLECAVLEDSTRILTATSIFDAFGRSRKGMNSRLEIEGTKLPPFLAAKNLEPYINQDVIDRTKLIEYKDGNATKKGYDAALLPDMCAVYLEARRNNALKDTQEKLAIQSEILLTAFAKVGIAALIDEATGFQRDRKHDALRLLLSKYIAEGLQKWMPTFPDSFFAELDRLYNNEPTKSTARPRYYGKFINKYIYEPIEHGYVKKELDKLNIKDDGTRRARFHQWLSENGRNILIHQIGRVQGVMETCHNIESFKDLMDHQKQISIAPYLFDDMNNIRS